MGRKDRFCSYHVCSSHLSSLSHFASDSVSLDKRSVLSWLPVPGNPADTLVPEHRQGERKHMLSAVRSPGVAEQVGGDGLWSVRFLSCTLPYRIRSRKRREPADRLTQILLLACGGRDGASRRGGWGPASSLLCRPWSERRADPAVNQAQDGEAEPCTGREGGPTTRHLEEVPDGKAKDTNRHLPCP
jgi:hypothetical protein